MVSPGHANDVCVCTLTSSLLCHGRSSLTPYLVASGSSEILLIAGSQIVDGVGAHAVHAGGTATSPSALPRGCYHGHPRSCHQSRPVLFSRMPCHIELAIVARANRLSSSLTARGPSNPDPKPESERSHVSSLVVSPLLPNVAPYPRGTPTADSGLHSLFQNDIQARRRVAFGSEATSGIGVALVLLGGLLGTVGIYVSVRCQCDDGIHNTREKRCPAFPVSLDLGFRGCKRLRRIQISIRKGEAFWRECVIVDSEKLRVAWMCFI
ncbi:hypothetical protein F5141DRAFT_1067155 [Pisolithus sp. B1]|nr:hypothetical protein F5141DRAFT_1067155 [Pisolithus sp. B1]